jgi:tetratricopeptide (TPR) repeat protein
VKRGSEVAGVEEEQVKCQGASHYLRWTGTGVEALNHEDGIPRHNCARRVTEWGKLKLREGDVARWINAGFAHPRDAAPWVAARIKAPAAATFTRAGVNLDEAKRWTKRAKLDATEALRWRTLGISPADYTMLAASPFPLTAIEPLLAEDRWKVVALVESASKAGLDPDFVLDLWHRLDELPSHERSEVARRLVLAIERDVDPADLEYLLQPSEPDRLYFLGSVAPADWCRAGVPVEAAARAMSEGWTLEETLHQMHLAESRATRVAVPKWIQIHVAIVEDEVLIESLRNAGLADGWVEFGKNEVFDVDRTVELARSGLPLRLVSRFFTFGMTDPEKIQGWFDVGVAPAAATVFANAGIPPSEGVKWLQSGFTAAEAAELGVAGNPDAQPSPRVGARWTDAFRRRRGTQNVFTIRRTDLGEVVRVVLASLDVEFDGSSSMYSSAWSRCRFLDGGWMSRQGYGFGSVSGEWIDGFHALRFICARMGIAAPRQLTGESSVPEQSELEADYVKHRNDAWASHLAWAAAARTDVAMRDQEHLADRRVGPDQWDEWHRLGFSPQQVLPLLGRGIGWAKRLRERGFDALAVAYIARHDLDPDLVQGYIELGVPLGSVSDLVRSGLTAAGLQSYLEVGLDAGVAAHWFEHGLDASRAVRWSQLALAPVECARLDGAGVEPVLADVEAQYRREIDEGSGTAAYMLGALLLEAGRTEDAVAPLRQAVEDGLAAAGRLGEAYFRLGRLSDAEQTWEAAADRYDGWSAVRLGMLREEQGDLPAAEDWYRKAVGYNDTWGMVRLGQLLRRRGQLEWSEEYLTKAATRGDAGGMDALVDLLRSHGRESEARRWELGDADVRSAVEVTYLDELS